MDRNIVVLRVPWFEVNAWLQPELLKGSQDDSFSVHLFHCSWELCYREDQRNDNLNAIRRWGILACVHYELYLIFNWIYQDLFPKHMGLGMSTACPEQQWHSFAYSVAKIYKKYYVGDTKNSYIPVYHFNNLLHKC